MTIEQVYAEGRIIRGEWGRREKDGRQLLCLYTALLGDPSARPETCSVEVCPGWLAHLLPWIDDAGTEERWPSVVDRVVRLASRFGHLSPAAEYRVRALIVQEALRHVPNEDADARAACEHVIDLCDRTARGEVVPDDVWAKAEETAEAVSDDDRIWEESATAAQAANAAATWMLHETVERAACAAAGAANAATGPREAAAAADRIIDGILNVIATDLEIAS